MKTSVKALGAAALAIAAVFSTAASAQTWEQHQAQVAAAQNPAVDYSASPGDPYARPGGNQGAPAARDNHGNRDSRDYRGNRDNRNYSQRNNNRGHATPRGGYAQYQNGHYVGSVSEREYARPNGNH